MSYVSNFMTDMAIFVFGNFLMDSILMAVHKSQYFKVSGDFSDTGAQVFEEPVVEDNFKFSEL